MERKVWETNVMNNNFWQLLGTAGVSFSNSTHFFADNNVVCRKLFRYDLIREKTSLYAGLTRNPAKKEQ